MGFCFGSFIALSVFFPFYFCCKCIHFWFRQLVTVVCLLFSSVVQRWEPYHKKMNKTKNQNKQKKNCLKTNQFDRLLMPPFVRLISWTNMDKYGNNNSWFMFSCVGPKLCVSLVFHWWKRKKPLDMLPVHHGVTKRKCSANNLEPSVSSTLLFLDWESWRTRRNPPEVPQINWRIQNEQWWKLEWNDSYN